MKFDIVLSALVMCFAKCICQTQAKYDNYAGGFIQPPFCLLKEQTETKFNGIQGIKSFFTLISSNSLANLPPMFWSQYVIVLISPNSLLT